MILPLAKVPLPNLQAKLQFLQQELSPQLGLQAAALGAGTTLILMREVCCVMCTIWQVVAMLGAGGACGCRSKVVIMEVSEEGGQARVSAC